MQLNHKNSRLNPGLKFFLSTPFNLSYWWNLGSLLSFLMITQILSGFILTFYYENSYEAFFSVWKIHLEVMSGSILHHTHMIFSSFIFMFLYLHLFKGLLLGSFVHLSLVWFIGWLLLILIMGVAFLGYVLPWGQMSLWGATVITNLVSVIPFLGNFLCGWIWGGYFVSIFSLKLFFSLHFILPFFCMVIIFIHIYCLHFSGSSNSVGSSNFSFKLEFLPVFFWKDSLNIIIILVLFMVVLFNPYMVCDPENFIMSNSMVSPLHIKPEWYFLQYYAILRAVPSKSGGVILFMMAVLSLGLLSLVKSYFFLFNFKIWILMSTTFFFLNIMLLWAGANEVVFPFFQISQILTILYFMWFFLLLFFTKKMSI